MVGRRVRGVLGERGLPEVLTQQGLLLLQPLQLPERQPAQQVPDPALQGTVSQVKASKKKSYRLKIEEEISGMRYLTGEGKFKLGVRCLFLS